MIDGGGKIGGPPGVPPPVTAEPAKESAQPTAARTTTPQAPADRFEKGGTQRDKAGAPEPGFHELREDGFGNALEPHHRPGLEERPPGSDHLLHEAWLRAGKDVADLALLLDGGPEGRLDRAAVERGDGLDLVQGDGEASAEMRGQNDLGVALQTKIYGGEHRPDAGIVGNVPILIQRDVEIHPDEKGLALDINLIKIFHCQLLLLTD